MRSPIKHQGIVGLRGHQSIGAVLSIGRKETFGQKGNTEKFYIVNPREFDGKRELHPAFKIFNEAPPEQRKVIYGNLVHARRTYCYWYNLLLHTNGKMHPNRLPFCCGNGIRATRWVGPGPEDFREIECPNERCEFRLCKPKKCKPKSSWIFRIRWEEQWKNKNLPTPVIRFDNQSWNSCANIYGEEEITREDGSKVILRSGFFGQIEMAAEQMGIKDYRLFSYPFMMTLTRETKKVDGVTQNYPVVTVTPEDDPISFFMRQRSNLKLIAEPIPVITISAEIEEEPNVMYDHPAQIAIPSKLEKSPKPPAEQKTGKSDTPEKGAAEKVSPQATGEAEGGKSEHISKYEPPKIEIPADWGVKHRKSMAIDGKTWENLSDTELDLTMRTNDNHKLRKGAYCEIEFRKMADEPLFPADWPERRKAEKGKGCSVPYKDCDAKVLENLRKDGDMNAVYEMRFKIDQKGEPIPSDEKLFATLHELMSKK